MTDWQLLTDSVIDSCLLLLCDWQLLTHWLWLIAVDTDLLIVIGSSWTWLTNCNWQLLILTLSLTAVNPDSDSCDWQVLTVTHWWLTGVDPDSDYHWQLLTVTLTMIDRIWLWRNDYDWQVLNLTHCLLAVITKAAPAVSDETFIDMMPVAWELLIESDQELAAAAGNISCHLSNWLAAECWHLFLTALAAAAGNHLN